METSKRLRELAQKTPEKILAEADETAKFEEELEARKEEIKARPFSIEDESRHLEWCIQDWVDKGADLKTVISIIAAGFVKVFASKGYVLKLKIEKLF